MNEREERQLWAAYRLILSWPKRDEPTAEREGESMSEDGWEFLHTNDHGDTIDSTGRIVNDDGSEPHGENMTPRNPTKQELLKHYADHPQPVRFRQIDVFTNRGEGDYVMRPDDDGDCLFYLITHELMTGSVNVRILINDETTPEEVTRALRKAIDLYSKGDPFTGDWLEGTTPMT